MGKWTSEQMQKYEKFYEIAMKRMAKGESEVSAFGGKPEGYSEWVKQHFKETGGIRLPKIKPIPPYECWNCNKVYSGSKCPYCGKFKPRKKVKL